MPGREFGLATVGSLVYWRHFANAEDWPVGLSGNYNVTRRARRSYETFHRDKRRSGVDRLAILETRNGGGRRASRLRLFLAALAGVLRPRCAESFGRVAAHAAATGWAVVLCRR